jgi:hypothetical protein
MKSFRSRTRRAAGSLGLAFLLLLPGMAAGLERPEGRRAAAPGEEVTEARLGLAGLWEAFARLFARDRPEANSAREKTGWMIDPNGGEGTGDSGGDTGWIIDPNGAEATGDSEGDTGWLIDPDG